MLKIRQYYTYTTEYELVVGKVVSSTKKGNYSLLARQK